MIPWIVVGYYTRNTLYEEKAGDFIKSLNEHKILYYIEPINNLGSWYQNTAYKPTFIKKMMREFAGLDIIYVDCDAKFFVYPKLFDELDCNVAVHEYDRAAYGRRPGTEILSGTIFLRNNPIVLELMEKWEQECRKRPLIWDQKSLEKVLVGNFYNLPPEYCKIWDVMRCVRKPVIVHYQASRIIRQSKNRCGLRMKQIKNGVCP